MRTRPLRSGKAAPAVLIGLFSAVLIPASPAVLRSAEKIITLESGWRLQSSALAGLDGAALSSAAFEPEGWHPVRVPSTVLNALVRAGVYPDPMIGLNNMRIPDASDAFNAAHDLAKFSHLPDGRNPWQDGYWYWTRFSLPEDWAGRHVFLNLEGINYRADVWLNGKRAADAGTLAGMFGKWRVDVSATARRPGVNTLAILIHPLDDPGLPAEPQLEAFGSFGLNGGPTGDIGKNVTMHCSVGWDWIPAVRDRAMGLWQPVSLEACGPVAIRDPRIVTDLPLPETHRADLRIEADLVNLTNAPMEGRLEVLIRQSEPAAEISLTVPVRLEPRQVRTIRLSPDDHPELRLRDPRLWWPNGMGDQPLYELSIRFVEDERLSDRVDLRFGIREIGTETTIVDGWARRDFFVNGKKIPIKGGAWVPDLLLARSPEKLARELRLIRDANLNLVRIWGGGPTPGEDFFRLCDELGLCVWHDFWITGDCQGTWGKGSQDYPLDAGLFLRNAADVMKAFRNHPSLIIWTAGNEGYPREEIYRPLRDEIVAGLDGTRPFLPSSGYREPPEGWGLSLPDGKAAGTYSGGPYWWIPPRDYYDLVDRGRDWLFKNEVGLPSLPPLETLRRFIPDLAPDPAVSFPLNHAWGYHDACEGNGKFSLYDAAIRGRYGEPRTLDEYLFRAQLVNAESYRAIFEAVNHAADRTAGVILWKVNPAWPSVVWQLYDWYLRPNAGYYFAKSACEPLHIQMNLDDHVVTVINTSGAARDGLTAEARLFDISGREIWSEQSRTGAAHGAARPLWPVPLPDAGVHFLDLALRDSNGAAVSRNFYWLSSDDDFTALHDLPEVELSVEILPKPEAPESRPTSPILRPGESEGPADAERTDVGGLEQGQPGNRDLGQRFRIRIANPTDHLAFFLEASIHAGRDGDEVLPSFWSDNYISLPPGGSRTLEVEIPPSSKAAAGFEFEKAPDIGTLSGTRIAPTDGTASGPGAAPHARTAPVIERASRTTTAPGSRPQSIGAGLFLRLRGWNVPERWRPISR